MNIIKKFLMGVDDRALQELRETSDKKLYIDFYQGALEKFPDYSIEQLHFVSIQGLRLFREKYKEGKNGA